MNFLIEHSKRTLLIQLLFILGINQVQAQSLLTQTFKFKSGVYLSFEEFQKNQPTYSGDAIKAAYFLNPQTEEIKVEYIRLLSTDTYLDLDSIWGISIKGIPYVQVQPRTAAKGMSTFAQIGVRGNICYYYYEDKEEKDIPFSVYNPFTKRPYRTAKVRRTVPVVVEKMFRFETGEVTDFNYQNVLLWIQEEQELVEALKSLGPKEAEEGLFKSLLLYDDKHEVQLRK